ncbi:MFS transporter [Umezawaea endophytica]|uniref:MFS transporter n=1 Tax=Umezawaea endophytica TaxID=1654476 RepID=A0A9X3ADV9_9PSEU|nr:MFS transporter [Umezawaea endophytica]MCS7476582.1 MFS transporter [Umezawaea endophytica]
MALWTHRDFRLLWVGDTVSQFGSSIERTVLPLLAATTLAATPWEMGVLNAAGTAAFLLIGLPAGVWADRLRRRPLMITTDLLRAGLLLSVPLAWWLGVLTLSQLVVVALLVGVCTVFFDVAYQSYLPSLIGREHLVEGNSKLQASQSVAEVSGPALAGGIAQWIGAANGVLATGLGYLSSALFLWRIKTVEPAPLPHTGRKLRTDIAEGLRFVFDNRSLRAIVSCTGTSNFFSGLEMAVLILFLIREVGLTAGVVGLLLSAGGVGGVLGAVTANWWNQRLGRTRAIWLPMLFTQPFGLLLPLTANDWRVGLSMVGMAITAYGVIIYNVSQVSFRQTLCPDHLLGRMNASIRFLVWGTIPLGGLIGGVLGGWAGVRTTLWIAMVGQILAVVWILLSPLRTTRDEAATVSDHG